MPQCYVASCRLTHRNKPKFIKFHKFPVALKKHWMKALGEDPEKIISNLSVLCSKHFKDEDYEIRGSVKRLKKNAIPSLELTSCAKRLTFEETTQANASRDEIPSPVLLPLSSTSGTENSGTEQKTGTRKRKRIQESDDSTDSDIKSIKIAQNITKTAIMKSFHNYSKMRKQEESDSVSTDSSSPLRQFRKPQELSVSSPTKSVSSSVEKKRKLIKTYHSYSHSPSYVQKQLKIQKEKNIIMKRKLLSTSRRNITLKRKVNSLRDIITDLKQRKALSDSSFTILEQTLSGIPLSLMQRLSLKSRYGKLRTKYPIELRSFAMTLQFYSPKAYEYVRKTFNHALPHQSVIRSWYSKVDCEPGFSAPAFSELRSKVAEEKTKNRTIYCSLMLDEMAIKKQIEFDGKTTRGYVDFGSSIENDEVEEATEALVIMVVAINGSWKLPVAYFLIKQLSGEERANIIRETLIRLDESGIKIVSLTCDGPNVHIKMMKSLGCNVTDVNNIISWFKHPITNENIYVIFDICHMLKLIRNNWARLEQIKDPSGEIINWRYIVELYELQEKEMFSLGNKLRRSHVEWRKQIMKVHLAAHTLSASVADALEFLDKDMHLPQFANVSATVKFIRNVDQLFDMLNSRNIFGSGFKAPLRQTNEKFWRPFFENMIEYFKKCTTVENIPLVRTKNKTPFIGFICSTTSFLKIAQDYLKDNKLNYILAYKFSQDHLELFFCCMRCRNGWNNNPTALQFIRSYKKLLLHHDVKNISGNCIPQDSTNVLFVSSTRREPSTSDIQDMRLRNQDGSEALMEILDMPVNLKLSDLAENVVTYISGYVVKMLEKRISCSECKTYISQEHCPQHNSCFKLLSRKQRGGLKVPSKDLKEICLFVEIKIRNLFFMYNRMPSFNNYLPALVFKTVEYFLVEKPNIFENINNHIFDLSIEEDLHKKKLIQEIASCYCKIRFHNLAKRQTEKIRGENIRTVLNRTILFRHQ